MRTGRLGGARACALSVMVTACLAASGAHAQDADEPRDPAPAAEADDAGPVRWKIPRALTEQERAGFTSIERWRLPELELPAGVTREPGRFAVSVQPLVFLDMPAMEGLLPAPTEIHSEVWTTTRDDQPPQRGGLMLLRYPDGVPQVVREFLPANLWGRDGGPTALHPENVVFNGEFVLMLSFEADDPTGDWLRAQILEHTGVRLPRSWAAARTQLLELAKHYLAGDRVAGQTVFYENAELLQENAMAQFTAAEFARWDQDWERADVHYSWVAHLDHEGIDPFPDEPSLRWTLADGYGITSLVLGRDGEAFSWLSRARDIAVAEQQPELAAKSGYNLACAMARTDQPRQAVEMLQSCAEVDAKYRAQALADPDFESLRDRDDFQAFVRG